MPLVFSRRARPKRSRAVAPRKPFAFVERVAGGWCAASRQQSTLERSSSASREPAYEYDRAVLQLEPCFEQLGGAGSMQGAVMEQQHRAASDIAPADQARPACRAAGPEAKQPQSIQQDGHVTARDQHELRSGDQLGNRRHVMRDGRATRRLPFGFEFCVHIRELAPVLMIELPDRGHSTLARACDLRIVTDPVQQLASSHDGVVEAKPVEFLRCLQATLPCAIGLVERGVVGERLVGSSIELQVHDTSRGAFERGSSPASANPRHRTILPHAADHSIERLARVGADLGRRVRLTDCNVGSLHQPVNHKLTSAPHSTGQRAATPSGRSIRVERRLNIDWNARPGMIVPVSRCARGRDGLLPPNSGAEAKDHERDPAFRRPARWRTPEAESIVPAAASGRVVIELTPVAQHATNIRASYGRNKAMACRSIVRRTTCRSGATRTAIARGNSRQVTLERLPSCIDGRPTDGWRPKSGQRRFRSTTRHAAKRGSRVMRWSASAAQEPDSGNGAELYVVISMRRAARSEHHGRRSRPQRDRVAVDLPRGTGRWVSTSPSSERRSSACSGGRRGRTRGARVLRTDTATFTTPTRPCDPTDATTGTRCRPVTSTSATCRFRFVRNECALTTTREAEAANSAYAINPALEVEALARAYSERGRVQIRDFLNIAGRAGRAADRSLRLDRRRRVHQGPHVQLSAAGAALGPADRQRISAEAAGARHEYQFFHH